VNHAVLALALTSVPPSAQPGGNASVPPQSCEGHATPNVQSLGDLNRHFAQRAIEVVRAAYHVDRRALATMVSPTARFTVWSGDVGLGGKPGVEGALEFAQNLHAMHFRYLLPFAGPLGADPCGIQTAQVSFSSPYADRAFIVDFRFERDLLVEAVGREGLETQGELLSGTTNG
jgi:hypothetical protein